MAAKLVHVISGLSVGGAEMMLQKVVACSYGDEWHHHVISLTTDGPVGDLLRSTGASVECIGMQRGAFSISRFASLAARVRAAHPDVVHTWMYHSDLLGGTAARIATRAPVVWGVHNTDFHVKTTKRTTFLTRRACVLASRFVPSHIICCSEAARTLHESLGYPAGRMSVIPNGFDVRSFAPDASARREVRADLGLGETDLVVGMAARFDPQKGYDVLVKAAGVLLRRHAGVRFVLCGTDVTWDNSALTRMIEIEGATHAFRLLGRRTDMPRVYAALDVATLTSGYGEAFPLMLGEAMACGVPCVATDVGDSAFIIGDTGRTVPPNQPQALADAWEELLLASGERAKMGESARRRVVRLFALDSVVERHLSVYRAVMH